MDDEAGGTPRPEEEGGWTVAATAATALALYRSRTLKNGASFNRTKPDIPVAPDWRLRRLRRHEADGGVSLNLLRRRGQVEVAVIS